MYLFAHHSVLVHSHAITQFHLGAAQYSPSLPLWVTEQCHWGSWELSAHMGFEIASCLIPTSLTFKQLVPSVKQLIGFFEFVRYSINISESVQMRWRCYCLLGVQTNIQLLLEEA